MGRATRVIRRVLTAAAATLVVAAAVPAPAQAHAGLALVVHDDGRGSVSVDVAWADGHPVTEPVAGTLIAFAPDGTQVGPAPLSRLPGASTLVYRGALRPGSWQVTADVALPAIGRCEAPVTVAAADAPAKPGETRCAPSEAPAAAAAAAPAPDRKPTWPVWLAVLGAAAAAVLLFRRLIMNG